MSTKALQELLDRCRSGVFYDDYDGDIALVAAAADELGKIEATPQIYATLTEHNGHEGETWRHYIPIAIDGNQPAIDALAVALAQLDHDDDDIEFELDQTPLAEHFVDDRVSMGDSGYMDAHTKLAGRLGPIPPEPEGFDDMDGAEPWLVQVLYKGGIRKLMTP